MRTKREYQELLTRTIVEHFAILRKQWIEERVMQYVQKQEDGSLVIPMWAASGLLALKDADSAAIYRDIWERYDEGEPRPDRLAPFTWEEFYRDNGEARGLLAALVGIGLTQYIGQIGRDSQSEIHLTEPKIVSPEQIEEITKQVFEQLRKRIDAAMKGQVDAKGA